MALNRERRSNAGSKMNQLLNEKGEDDFYETAYGGFAEDMEDGSYASENEAAPSSDEFDTDVDTSQDEEIEQAAASSGDETNERKLLNAERADKLRETKRKRALFSAATLKKSRVEQTSEKESDREGEETTTHKRKRKESAGIDAGNQNLDAKQIDQRRSLRTATSEKRRALENKLSDERAAEIQRKHIRDLAARKQGEVRRLTQAELLEEAKRTEQENLKSLERFRLDELEYERARAKAKSSLRRGTQSDAVIRVRSVTMRNNEAHAATRAVSRTHADAQTSTQFRSAELGSTTERRAAPSVTVPDATRYEQTFVSFEGELADFAFETAFAAAMPDARNRAALNRITHVRHLCPITGMQARYFDPLTLTPYANAHAFKILRMLYRRVVESGEKPLDLLKRFKQHALLISSQQQQQQQQQQHQPAAAPSHSAVHPQAPGTATSTNSAAGVGTAPQRAPLGQPQRAQLVQQPYGGVRPPPNANNAGISVQANSARITTPATAGNVMGGGNASVAVQRVPLPAGQVQRMPVAQNAMVAQQRLAMQPNTVVISGPQQHQAPQRAAQPGRPQPQIINLTYSEKLD